MMPSAARRPRSRPLATALRHVAIGTFAVLALLAPVVVLLLAFEGRPRVVDTAPPDAAAAGQLRVLGERLQAFVESEGAAGSITASEAEINAAIASVARFQPGVAGRVMVREGGVDAALSVGGPLVPAGRWVNLRATLGPTDAGFAVTSLRLGALPLPPAATMGALRWGLDRYLGDGLGTALEQWIAALRVDPPQVTLAVAPGELAGGGRLELLKARLRALANGATEPRRVHVHLWAMHRAARRGQIADEGGSLLPFLRFSLAFAAEQETADPQAEMRAAIFALALYCGDPRFGLAIGVAVDPAMQGNDNRCAARTLAGRQDLVRHFVLSAGVHAASTDRAVVGLGELKELLDSNPGGSGFSFDDMAANLAGARFAMVLMEAPRSAWPALERSIDGEEDILPALDGLPTGMSAEDFQAAYGDIDSPAYRALLAEIEARVAALPFHGSAD